MTDLSNRDAIRAAVEERNRQAAEMARKSEHVEKTPESAGAGTGAVPSRFVKQCLAANEVGDGMLFAEMKKGEFIKNMSTGEWLNFGGHHWEIDQLGKALAAVEDVAVRYLEEAKKLVDPIASADGDDSRKAMIQQQKKIYDRVRRLRCTRGRVNCLEMASTNPVNPLHILGDDLDKKTMLLACANGVIDLRTGELRPGRPEDYILKASPVEYAGIDAPAPKWEQALLEIFSGDTELIEFFAAVVGYALTGINNLAIMTILIGKGRNGKSMVIEEISDVVGELAVTIPTEMLLDQGRFKSSSGPSPDIMALQGALLAICSESDEGRKLSPSRVKWATGNDTMVGRFPHDKRLTSFKPKHTLILLTNSKPHAPAGDFALWERMLLIPFKRSFVNREPQGKDEVRADLDLPEKLKSEHPGILAWIVRGCLAYQKYGLNPPAIVRDATADYRRNEDILADFIDECCVLERYAECKASILYAAFRTWWKENVSVKGIPSSKKFGQMMKDRFKKEKHGHYIYYGIGLLEGMSE